MSGARRRRPSDELDVGELLAACADECRRLEAESSALYELHYALVALARARTEAGTRRDEVVRLAHELGISASQIEADRR